MTSDPRDPDADAEQLVDAQLAGLIAVLILAALGGALYAFAAPVWPVFPAQILAVAAVGWRARRIAAALR